MFPERDGWHALDTGKFIHVWHWYAKKKWWERKPNTDIAHEPKHFSHFSYIGPVLTPAQINEMLAAEREQCAKICDEFTPDKAGIADDAFLTGRYLALAGIAEKIRNLGAAP